ncbi:MAG: bifunctional UDP-N-acetylglucosamine diphosphorylase/glucosamine-1-phosphate N-acetyltransferase GlmU [Nitriliruptoraceae bacterium]|nr:bifunctional UDP-N-acetylglucosamine diphosphorylase/glucosamine-1-phosphate N-acetyltransferase GlmU [Nitriliruptoraceae bacterium]
MAADLAVIVLAAGKGTRFRSERAKVLHRAAGRSLVGHVLEAVRPLGAAQVVVVVGHQADEVRAEAEASGVGGLTTVLQAEQRGTGHAVQQAMPALDPAIGRVLVLFGDTPMLTAPTLEQLLATGAEVTGAMLTAVLDDPTGYGRVLRDDRGDVARIVEHRDASEEQRAVGEINAGMFVVDRAVLADALDRLGDDNDQGEIYLTDVVGIAADAGHRIVPLVVEAAEVAGVNDRAQLAQAAAALRAAHAHRLMTEVGVSIVDPAHTYLDVDVVVERDAVLLPGTVLEAGTTIGAGATVGPNSHLTTCEVGAGAVVHSTRGVEARIGPGAQVGPFSHLRAGTVLAAATKVGAYVETKNARIGEGSKVPHLAYVGDATVGEGANLACGVITVNYDGRTKSHTTVGDGAFVGCDTMLVAPVTIGVGAYTAAGSTITEDVPDDALAIARSRQTVKPGWAARQRENG